MFLIYHIILQDAVSEASFKLWLQLVFLRNFQDKSVGLQLFVNPPYRKLVCLPCKRVFVLSTSFLFKPPSGAWVGGARSLLFAHWIKSVFSVMIQVYDSSSGTVIWLYAVMQLLRAVGNTFRSRFGIAQCCKAHSESSQCPQPTEKQSRTTTGKTMKSHFMVLALGRKAQSSPTAQHQPRDTENKVGCQSLIPPLSKQASDVPVLTLFQPKV